MTPPTITFIVNTCDDPDFLTCCLASLRVQSSKLLDYYLYIVIADNSKNTHNIEANKRLALQFDAVWLPGLGDNSCYETLNVLSKHLCTDWLCFPSSDGYYVPGFCELMLTAGETSGVDFVYCDTLYDPRLHGRGIYSVLHTHPQERWIDKTSFIIRKKAFKGFPPHPQDWRDGALVEQLVKDKVSMTKAMGVLVVHN
jgi:hypothetical protein